MAAVRYAREAGVPSGADPGHPLRHRFDLKEWNGQEGWKWNGMEWMDGMDSRTDPQLEGARKPAHWDRPCVFTPTSPTWRAGRSRTPTWGRALSAVLHDMRERLPPHERAELRQAPLQFLTYSSTGPVVQVHNWVSYEVLAQSSPRSPGPAGEGRQPEEVYWSGDNFPADHEKGCHPGTLSLFWAGSCFLHRFC